MQDDFLAQARALGFDKPHKYAHIERERRWLCAGLPNLEPAEIIRITDLYIDGGGLRLRTMDGRPDGAMAYKFQKKADLSPDRRLITTIYLTEAEHALFKDLPGRTLEKTRRNYAIDGAAVSVDAFAGPLAGLFLAECEFQTDEEMAAFRAPSFALSEVTHDGRYAGGALAANGLPDPISNR